MYKVNNTLTSAYGDMDLPKKQGPVRKVYIISFRYNYINLTFKTLAVHITIWGLFIIGDAILYSWQSKNN